MSSPNQWSVSRLLYTLQQWCIIHCATDQCLSLSQAVNNLAHSTPSNPLENKQSGMIIVIPLCLVTKFSAVYECTYVRDYEHVSVGTDCSLLHGLVLLPQTYCVECVLYCPVVQVTLHTMCSIASFILIDCVTHDSTVMSVKLHKYKCMSL